MNTITLTHTPGFKTALLNSYPDLPRPRGKEILFLN